MNELARRDSRQNPTREEWIVIEVVEDLPSEAVAEIVDAVKQLDDVMDATRNIAQREATEELRKLEVDYTALGEQYAKLQQQTAGLLLGNKQLKGAVSRLDEMTSFLTHCIAGLPVEPQAEHIALNMMAATLLTTQTKLSRHEALVGLLKKARDDAANKKTEATTDDGDSKSEG